jgi:crotonobetainyl-CoA:carnitine CoA-transferase CaiB-like acyl-CoA transferase
MTRILAGPLCTMILGDLGATVIKIENPQIGDDTREWGPPWLGDDDNRQSAYFLSVNRNKKSMTINLKNPHGIEIIRQLILQSDVLVENFKVGQMASYGLGYADVHSINPRMVYCSITGFGQSGQYSTRPGYDYVIQAMSGLMSITGMPNQEPQKVGVAIADVIAGLYAANGIQAALRFARLNGVGQHVDINLFETQLASLVNIASNYLVTHHVPQRLGNSHPNIVPYQVFQAQDQGFVVAVGNDRQFKALCHLLELEGLATDSRFNTNSARVMHRDTLIPILAERFLQRTASTWVEALLEAEIPAGQINTVEQALNDPHIKERGLIGTIPLSNGEHWSYVGSAIRLSETPNEPYSAPPGLGEHTHEILQHWLNYDAEQIQHLKQAGVIG